jgi:hypothetical protein
MTKSFDAAPGASINMRKKEAIEVLKVSVVDHDCPLDQLDGPL